MLKKHPPKTPVDKTGRLHTSADQNPPAARLPGREVSLAWEQPRGRGSMDCQAFIIYVPQPIKFYSSYKHEESHLALASRLITGSFDLIWMLCNPEALGPTFLWPQTFFYIFDSSWANMIFVKVTETFAELFHRTASLGPLSLYFSHQQSHCFYQLL